MRQIGWKRNQTADTVSVSSCCFEKFGFGAENQMGRGGGTVVDSDSDAPQIRSCRHIVEMVLGMVLGLG